MEVVDLQMPLAAAELDHKQLVHVDGARAQAKKVGQLIGQRVVDERLLLAVVCVRHVVRRLLLLLLMCLQRRIKQEHGRQVVVAVARKPTLEIGHALTPHQRLGFVVDERDFVGSNRQQPLDLLERDRLGRLFARAVRGRVKHNLLDREQHAAVAVQVAAKFCVIFFQFELVVVVGGFREALLLVLFCGC